MEIGLFNAIGDLFIFAQLIFFGIGFWKVEQAIEKYPMQALMQ